MLHHICTVWKHTSFGCDSLGEWRCNQPCFGKCRPSIFPTSILKLYLPFCCCFNVQCKWWITNYLLQWLCSWDPRRRPTAVEVLQHPFFQVIYLADFHTTWWWVNLLPDLTIIMCCSHASMSLLRFASNQLDMHQHHHQVSPYPSDLHIHVLFH